MSAYGLNGDSSIDNYDFSSLKKETGFVINSKGYIVYVEAKIFDLLGYTDTELIGKKSSDMVYDKNSLINLLNLVYTTQNLNLNLRHKDGHPVNVYINLDFVKGPDSKLNKIYGVLIESRLKAINTEFNTISKIINNSKDVLYRYSFVEKRIIYLSKSVFQLTGFKADDIIENVMLMFKRVHPEDLKKYHRSAYIQTDFTKPLVTRLRHRNGHYIWVEDYMTPIFSDEGSLLFIDGACRDISAKIEKDNKLQYLTYHDALSGLYNRNYFEEKLNFLDKESDTPVAIILCDLDNLKIVNDSLGHDKGDEMIAHVGKLLASMVDVNSFAARIGGDEFVIVIKNASLFSLKQLVNNLVDMIENYNKSLGEYTINMSIGSAFLEHSANNMQKLFKLADNQMYLNKSMRKAL